MKKIYLFMLVFLLVGSIVAVEIILNNRDLSLTETQKAKLESINLGSYETSDYELGGLSSRCLNKELCTDSIIESCELEDIPGSVFICANITITKCKNIINTCSGYMDESKLDDWEEKRLGRIANVSEDRKNNQPEKVSEGVTTIK